MNCNQNRGITLVALVITIIVLLILAGVTISLVVNGGLFQQAQNASETTEEVAADEKAQTIIAMAMIEKSQLTPFFESIEKAVKGTTFEENGVTGNNNKVLIKDSITGNEYIIEEDFTITKKDINEVFNLFDINAWYDSLILINSTKTMTSEFINLSVVTVERASYYRTDYSVGVKAGRTYKITIDCRVNVRNGYFTLGTTDWIDDVTFGSLYPFDNRQIITKTFTPTEDANFYLKGYVSQGTYTGRSLDIFDIVVTDETEE